jgi:lipid-A-disaccharide synthase
MRGGETGSASGTLMTLNVFIVAGDVSGDRYAAELIAEIKKLEPGALTSGMGGPCLDKSLDRSLYQLTSKGAFGFTEPVKLYLELRKIFKEHILKNWNGAKPDIVILVDFYGFNIHVAKEAAKRNIPVYYYVSPQVWASRKGRIKQLKKYVTKMFPILPFEEEMYAKQGVKSTYLGHPLVDHIPGNDVPAETRFSKKIIGFFPGSRANVIKKHIPILIKVITGLRNNRGLECVCFSSGSNDELLKELRIPIFMHDDYARRKSLSIAVSVSGTISLENAILGIPMIVFYKLSKMNYLVAKLIANVKYITMVNILAGKMIIPEFIQKDATPANILKNIDLLLNDKDKYMDMVNKELSFRTMLGKPGVSGRVAKDILENYHDLQKTA